MSFLLLCQSAVRGNEAGLDYIENHFPLVKKRIEDRVQQGFAQQILELQEQMNEKYAKLLDRYEKVAQLLVEAAEVHREDQQTIQNLEEEIARINGILV